MDAAQVLNGVALGSLLMVLSSGLAMIYGLRGVTNFAHGALYMSAGLHRVLASPTGSASGWRCSWCRWPSRCIGVVLELVFFRPLQHRSHIELGLITFGLALMAERHRGPDLGRADAPGRPPPEVLAGTTSVLGVDYPTYRLAIILVAVVMAAALVLWLRRSRTGLHIRAASQDIETAAIMGIDVDRVEPRSSSASVRRSPAWPARSPRRTSRSTRAWATRYLIIVLIVVVVGGIGSIGGAMVAGMGLGIIQTVGTVWSPSFAVLVPYLALTIVLLWRPTGLAGKRVS